MKNLTVVMILFAGTFLAKSQQLVYKPINPAFGGDTFNYQWLLSSANAQNQFDEKSNIDNLLSGLKLLDSFTQSLNRQILSQLLANCFRNSLAMER